ncbi:MAG: hypothetical protein GX921_00140 [Bacteroidales bacterium]|nr:hypothetical protein [Bacteroidales bacterium]
MKKAIYIIAILLTASLFSISAQNKKAVVGKWSYEATQAPYGYNKGVFEVKMEAKENEKEEALTAEVTFTSGQRSKFQNVTMRNDTVWATAFVDGENIQLEAKVGKQTMTGTVDTSMGKLSITADKVVEEKKE